MEGTLALISGEVKITWQIVDGGLSISHINGYDVLSFYAQTLTPSTISMGSYDLDYSEGNPLEYVENENVIIQLQYRLPAYKPEHLVGMIFQEEVQTTWYDDDATSNSSNICLHLHGPIWDSKIEILSANEGVYNVNLRGVSDALNCYFQTGYQTTIELECKTILSTQKAQFWQWGDEIL